MRDTPRRQGPSECMTLSRCPEHKALRVDDDGTRLKTAERFARTTEERRLLRVRHAVARGRELLARLDDTIDRKHGN